MFDLLRAAVVFAAVVSDPAAMLHKADAPHDAFPEGVIRLRVAVSEHGKDPVETSMDLYVQGKDHSLCVFREGKQKGRKILTSGDKVWLTGCNVDLDCPGGMYCVREEGQTGAPGLCLVGAAADGGTCKAATRRLMMSKNDGAWAARDRSGISTWPARAR